MSLLRLLSCALALTLAGCKCGERTLGPLNEVAPADLGPDGLMVDQPLAGAEVHGAWVAVTGWFDPKKVQLVTVTGAASLDFYLPTGHQGLASVAVHQRADGRFIAPRVPVAEGATRLTVLGLSEGVVTAAVELSVTGSQVNEIPATLIADPPSAEGATDISLKAYATRSVDTWQWDFEGDTTFDAESPTATHAYSEGLFQVIARTQVDGRWVYATAPLRIQPASAVTHTASVLSPRAISVVPALATQITAVDELARTRAVMVADGDVVKVFNAKLEPLTTLTGLSKPTGMAGDDQGRFYVADTGNNRVVRFSAAGQLEATIDGPADGGFHAPTSLGLGFVGVTGGVDPVLFVLDDGGGVSACRVNAASLCLRLPSDPLDAFVIAPGWLAGETCDGLDAPNHLWGRRGQTLVHASTGGVATLPPVNGLRGFTGTFDEVVPYWAAIDGKGQLLEWAVSQTNTRRSQLAADANVLAIDEGATAFLHARDFLGDNTAVGPVVLYVAGPGKVERRVTGALEVMR